MASTTLRYLQDDDDPLNDLLGGGGEPNASSAPAPSYDQTPPEPDHSLEETLLQEPAGSPPPPAAPQQPPPRDDLDAVRSMIGQRSDPELDAAYRNAQIDALKHGGFDDSKYGVGEALRDNGAALIASILDIGFNKGRGLGGIVGATANEVGRQEAQREKQRQDARDFALKMRPKDIDPVTQYLALGRLGVSQQNAGTSASRVAGTEAWRGQQSDPNSALSRTKVKLAGDTAAASTGARQDVEHENNPRTASDQAQIAGAKTAAELGEQHNAAPQIAADAANKEAAVTGAHIQTGLDYAPQTNAASAAKSQGDAAGKIAGERAGQAAGRPVPSGFHTVDDARWNDVTQDPVRYREAMADSQMANQLQSAADQLADIRKKYGPQAFPSAGSGEYNALHLAVLGAANRVIGQAGTVNAGERQLMESMIPGIKPNWGDLFGWLKDSNLNAQQLEGFAKGLQTVLNARASSYGLGIGNAQVPAPAASPVPAGDNLGTSSAPPIPQQQGAGTQQVRLRSPRGKTGMLTLSPAELEKFKAAGWEIL